MWEKRFTWYVIDDNNGRLVRPNREFGWVSLDDTFQTAEEAVERLGIFYGEWSEDVGTRDEPHSLQEVYIET